MTPFPYLDFLSPHHLFHNIHQKLFSFWGVGLPLGYVLTFTDLLCPALGAAGFWVGLTAGLTSASVLLGWRLFRYRPGNHHHGEPDSRTSVQAGSATN